MINVIKCFIEVKNLHYFICKKNQLFNEIFMIKITKF